LLLLLLEIFLSDDGELSSCSDSSKLLLRLAVGGGDLQCTFMCFLSELGCV
jgi:hypothetical protein